MSYDNLNKGAIWRNKDKQHDSQPDFKGNINVNGVECWLSGWVKKQGDNPNAPSVRLSVQPKEQVHAQGYQQVQQNLQQPQQIPNQQPAQNFNDYDDDVGF
jgi:hypothetical protein